jgi:hypothetical protein
MKAVNEFVHVTETPKQIAAEEEARPKNGGW